MSNIIGRAGSKRRLSTILGTTLAVIALSTLIIPTATAGTGPSVVDYSQCANGKPGTGDKTTCNKGWIGGILNANNSQYREDEVTAQRLVVSVPLGGTGHSVTLKYLWNKGSGHAYDSLAKWNTTITGVTSAGAACRGVPGDCPATDGNWNGGDGEDKEGVPNSTCSNPSGGINHQRSNRDIVIFGGVIIDITDPVNTSSTCSTSADNYEEVTINYTVTSADKRVMFLFGGHLAASLTPPSSPRGWGGTLVNGECQDCVGASSISGGPYHIKLVALDGASAGNRDNQIMSNAVLPLTVSSITTTQSFRYSVTLDDSLTLSPLSGGGTADFFLYDDLTKCQAGGTSVGAADGLVYKKTGVDVVTGAASTTGSTGNEAGSNVVSPTAKTTYYWYVTYSGDSTHLSATSTCTSEPQTVYPPTNTDGT